MDMERERVINRTDGAVRVGDNAVADSDWTSRAHHELSHVTDTDADKAAPSSYFGGCEFGEKGSLSEIM